MVPIARADKLEVRRLEGRTSREELLIVQALKQGLTDVLTCTRIEGGTRKPGLEQPRRVPHRAEIPGRTVRTSALKGRAL